MKVDYIRGFFWIIFISPSAGDILWKFFAFVYAVMADVTRCTTVLSLLETPGVKAMVRGASIPKTNGIPIKHRNEGKYILSPSEGLIICHGPSQAHKKGGFYWRGASNRDNTVYLY